MTDSYDLISGSNGLAACADATLILDRDGQGVRLYGRGRDVEEFDKALSFDRMTGRWSVLGDADELHRSDARRAILDVLTSAGEAIGPKQIAAEARLKEANVRYLLGQMVRAGEVNKEGFGRYTPAHTPHTEEEPKEQSVRGLS